MALPAAISALINNLETTRAVAPIATSGDFQFLKMAKGEWLYGAEGIEVDDASFFIVDPATYSQGFVAWYDSELIEERMALSGEAPLTKASLPELPVMPKTKNDPDGCVWAPQVALAIKGVEGAEEGMQMLYKTSSKGGLECVSDFLDLVIARGKAGETSLCAVVALETSNYRHKKYGKIYKPVLAVDDRMDVDGVAPEAKKEAPPVIEAKKEAPEPKKRARRSRKAAA